MGGIEDFLNQSIGPVGQPSGGAVGDPLGGLPDYVPPPDFQLGEAVKKNPDEEAKKQKLSRDTGFPVEAVETDPKAIEQQLLLNDLNLLLGDNPTTRLFLSDPAVADIAHDDVKNLTGFEQAWKSSERMKQAEARAEQTRAAAEGEQGIPESILRSMTTGVVNLGKLPHQFDRFIWDLGYDATGVEFFQRQAQESIRQTQIVGELGKVVEDETRSALPDWARSGAQSAGQTIVTLPVAVARPVLALLGLSAASAGESYDVGRDAGLSPLSAGIYALTDGAVEYATEKFGLEALVRGIKMGAPILKMIGTQLLTELPGEQAATFLQDLNKWWSIEANQGKTFGDYLDERPDAAAQTLMSTLVTMGITTTVANLAGKGGEIDAMGAKIAEDGMAVMEQARKVVEKSALAQRDPRKFIEHGEAVMRDAGIDRVWIDAQAFQEHFGDEDKLTEVVREWGLDENTVKDAILLGGDIELTGEQFLRKVLIPNEFEKLKDFVRFHPEAKTAAEAKQYREEGLDEKLTEVSRDTQKLTPAEAETAPALTLAEEQIGLKALFSSAEEAGMTPKKYEAFLAALAKSQQTSQNRQQNKLLLEEKRKLGAEWRQLRETKQREVEAELKQRPAYAVLEALGQEQFSRRSVERALGGALFFDRAAGTNKFVSTDEQIAMLPRRNGKSIVAPKSSKIAVDAELKAQAHGYADAREMFLDLQTAVPLDQAVAKEVDTKMAAEHKTMADRRTAVLEAIESLHNDQQGEVLVLELNQLREAQKQGRLKPKLIKLAAKAKMLEHRVRDVTAEKYLAAERRHSKAAVRFLRGGRAVKVSTPPAAEKGMVRFYHGGETKPRSGWVSADIEYARNYGGEGSTLFYVDVPVGHKDEIAARMWDEADVAAGVNTVGRYNNTELSAELVKQMRPYYQESKSADRKAATRSKYQQVLNFYMAMEAFAARARVSKQLKWLRQFARDDVQIEGLPYESLLAIQKVLVRFNLGPQMSERKRGQLMAEAFANAVEIGASVVEIPEVIRRQDETGNTRNYRNLTLAEWNNLYQTIRAIHKAGIDENKFMKAEEKATVQSTADAVGDQIRNNAPGRSPDVESNRPGERNFRNRIEAANAMFHADTILVTLDGQDELGICYEALKGPLDHALTKGYRPGSVGYIARQKQNAQALLEIFDSSYTDAERSTIERKLDIPGLDRQGNKRLSRAGVISVLLNSGNEYNIKALLTGGFDARGNKRPGQFTPAELKAIHDFADKKDWDFAQKIGDHINALWPEIYEAVLRRKGYPPEKVDALPVETKYGTYRGWYYPLKFDGHQSPIVGGEDMKKLLEQARFGQFTMSHTRDGHTKARDNSGGLPVLLDLFVINTHLDQVLYDLEIGDAIHDIYKVLYHKDVRNAFRDVGRVDLWKALDLWLADAVTGELRKGGVDAYLRWFRTGFTVSKLALNVGVAALQFTGVAQSAVRIGKMNMFNGVKATLAHPVDAFRFAAENSVLMQQRQSDYHRDIMEASRALRESFIAKYPGGRKAAQVAELSFFYLMRKAQYVVDVMTWTGARMKGVEDYNGDIERANELADRMVVRAQGSGTYTERSALERGSVQKGIQQSEFVKLWTPMMGYFFTKANVAYLRAKRTNFRNPGQVVNFAADMALLYTFDALVTALLYGGWPDEDESWFGLITKSTAQGFVAQFPGARDVASYLQGYDTTAGSIGGLIKETADALDQIGQVLSGGLEGGAEGFTEGGIGGFIAGGIEGGADAIDLALMKNVNSVFGILAPYPSSFINKEAEAINRWMNDEEVDAFDFIFGPSFDR